MDPDKARLLTDFVMMVGMLRRDIRHNSDFDRYAGRFSRIEQKFSAFAELISLDDPELAKALHRAFQQPGVALAFKNAEHQKELKRQRSAEDQDGDS